MNNESRAAREICEGTHTVAELVSPGTVVGNHLVTFCGAHRRTWGNIAVVLFDLCQGNEL